MEESRNQRDRVVGLVSRAFPGYAITTTYSTEEVGPTKVSFQVDGRPAATAFSTEAVRDLTAARGEDRAASELAYMVVLQLKFEIRRWRYPEEEWEVSSRMSREEDWLAPI